MGQSQAQRSGLTVNSGRCYILPQVPIPIREGQTYLLVALRNHGLQRKALRGELLGSDCSRITKLRRRRWILADTLLFSVFLVGMLSGGALAQTPQPMPPGPPQDSARPLLTPVDQADENFTFLKDPSKRTDFWDFLKYIPLNQRGDVYLTFGFETRSEYEWFQNANWGAGPQTISGYYLQRVIPEGRLTIGSHFRLFASFQYDKEMGNNGGPRPGIDEDQGDFHEAFLISAPASMKSGR